MLCSAFLLRWRKKPLACVQTVFVASSTSILQLHCIYCGFSIVRYLGVMAQSCNGAREPIRAHQPNTRANASSQFALSRMCTWTLAVTCIQSIFSIFFNALWNVFTWASFVGLLTSSEVCDRFLLYHKTLHIQEEKIIELDWIVLESHPWNYLCKKSKRHCKANRTYASTENQTLQYFIDQLLILFLNTET